MRQTYLLGFLVAIATFGFAISTAWLGTLAPVSAEPYLILLAIAGTPTILATWRSPETPWFRYPVAASAGTFLGLFALLVVLRLFWPGQVMGCYVHTVATGGYDDWVCVGRIPLVTEGWPALSRAAWLAGIVLAILGPCISVLRPIARFNARLRSHDTNTGASTAT